MAPASEPEGIPGAIDARWIAEPMGDCGIAALHGSSRIFVLDPLARWIFDALREGLTPGEVSGALRDRFGLPPATAARDLGRFLRDLRQQAGGIPPPGAPSIPAAGIRPPVSGTPAWRRAVGLAEGVAILAVEDAGLAASMSPWLERLPAAMESPSARRVWLTGPEPAWTLSLDGTIRHRGAGRDAAIARSLKLLEHLGTWSGPRLIALHAAGLVTAHQQGILLIGASGSGKSTLAAALNAQGYRLLGDDVVPVRPDGHLLTIPSLLCLKQGSWPLLRDRFPELDRLPDLDWLGRPVRLASPHGERVRLAVPTGLFLLPVHRAGAKPSVEAMDPVRLLRHVLGARSILPPLNPTLLRALVRWLVSAPAFRLVYPDLESALRLAGECLGERWPGSMHRRPD